MGARVLTAGLGVLAACGGSDVDRLPDGGTDAPPANVLIELRLDGAPVALDPAFDPAVLEYTAAVPLSAAAVEIEVTAPGAVAIDGDPATSGEPRGIDLTLGANPVSVSAGGGRYGIAVDRGAGIAEVAGASGSTIGFGAAMALSGDTLVVGVPADDAGGVDAGAALVYVRDAAGDWQLEDTLRAGAVDPGDRFGAAVALDGDRVAIGAPGEDSAAQVIDGDESDNSASGAGAVYVFARQDGVWSQQAYLKAPNTDAADNFGSSVAIDGDRIAAGAPLEDSAAQTIDGDGGDDSAASAGAVYVFAFDGGGAGWQLDAYLKADNAESGDLFGGAVAISGDRIAVGAEAEAGPANATALAGAAYVFVRAGAAWSQQAIVRASNAGAGDNFGRALSLSGDTLAVGAFTEDSAATGVGGDGASDAVGNSGAAYVFVDPGTGVWAEQAYLKASNTEAGDLFGSAIAVDGDIIAVGAIAEAGAAGGVNGDDSNNDLVDAGAVYVFVRAAGSWSVAAYAKSTSPSGGAALGSSVAVDGFTVAAGAPGARAVRVFE